MQYRIDKRMKLMVLRGAQKVNAVVLVDEIGPGTTRTN